LELRDPEFHALLRRWIGALPPREYSPAVLAHALAYPWERPAHSYVLHDDIVELLDEIGPDRREAVLRRFLTDRTPLLAIGSNSAPDVLRRKFAHFADQDDRDALVITGWLHEFDVGASAQLAAYGALPATIFPSPGTAARTSILWLTEPQFTQLVWSELSYGIGTLHTRFAADEPGFDVEQVVVFVSRFGAFCVDDDPVALAAVPAQGRTARALTQHELLTNVAATLRPASTPEELVRAIHDNPGALVERLAPTVWSRGRRFESPRWAPLVRPPAGG
jgi:hypothetical protein